MTDVLATIAPRRGNREALLAQGKTSAASGTLGIDAQQVNALKGQKQTSRNDAAALSGRRLLTTVYPGCRSHCSLALGYRVIGPSARLGSQLVCYCQKK